MLGTGGSGTASGNYLTGFYNSAGSNEYRSFFTFDLSGVSGIVTTAQFNVSLDHFGGGPSPVTLNLVAYSGNISILDSGGAGVAGFVNLASGTLLGSETVDTSATGTLSIGLNSAAFAALQAAEGSDFAIGGSLLGVPPVNFLFGGSLDNDPTQLVVTTTSAIPEPTSLLLVGTGLGAIGLAAWRRRT